MIIGETGWNPKLKRQERDWRTLLMKSSDKELKVRKFST